MREILCKAKTKEITYNYGKNDGEWVIGYLYHDINKWMIRHFDSDNNIYIHYEINPETICQYIGINDKNNKRIWENDIVKTNNGRVCKAVWFSSPQYQGWDLFPLEYISPPPSQNNLWKELVVIGNVFDNLDSLNNN